MMVTICEKFSLSEFNIAYLEKLTNTDKGLTTKSAGWSKLVYKEEYVGWSLRDHVAFFGEGLAPIKVATYMDQTRPVVNVHQEIKKVLENPDFTKVSPSAILHDDTANRGYLRYVLFPFEKDGVMSQTLFQGRYVKMVHEALPKAEWVQLRITDKVHALAAFENEKIKALVMPWIGENFPEHLGYYVSRLRVRSWHDNRRD